MEKLAIRLGFEDTLLARLRSGIQLAKLCVKELIIFLIWFAFFMWVLLLLCIVLCPSDYQYSDARPQL